MGEFARYHMTGPTGHVISSAWEFLTIDEPFRFEVLDSFVDDGTASESFPTMRATFEFAATPSGSRLTNTTHFASADDLAQTVDMGAVEAAPLAFNQLDRVLAGLRAFAEGKGTRVERLDDVRARITRLVEGPIDLVWRAHVEPDLIRRWLLGPAGWRMSVCRVEAWVGGTFEHEWEPEPGTEGQLPAAGGTARAALGARGHPVGHPVDDVGGDLAAGEADQRPGHDVTRVVHAGVDTGVGDGGRGEAQRDAQPRHRVGDPLREGERGSGVTGRKRRRCGHRHPSHLWHRRHLPVWPGAAMGPLESLVGHQRRETDRRNTVQGCPSPGTTAHGGDGSSRDEPQLGVVRETGESVQRGVEFRRGRRRDGLIDRRVEGVQFIEYTRRLRFVIHVSTLGGAVVGSARIGFSPERPSPPPPVRR